MKNLWSVFSVIILALIGAIAIEMATLPRTASANANVEAQIAAHKELLDAMSTYFSRLQALKILPSPLELEKLEKEKVKKK